MAQDWTASAVGAGTFYLYNVGGQGFLVGANNWGTRASVDATGGIPVTLAGSGTTYTISTSPTYNGSFLGSNGYVDSSTADWTFEAVDGQENVYMLKTGSSYIYADATADANLLAKTTTVGANPGNNMGYWKLISKENLFADFESASESSPVWASCLISNPGFGRNITAGWGWTVTADNKNMSGGTNENRCAEHWRSAFTVKQTISGIPNGKYGLRVQAALTDYTDKYDGDNYPVAYIKSGKTESTKPFNNMDNSDRGTDMSTLSNSFSAGKYFTDVMVVTVTNGEIEIGVRGTRTDTWCIYDNFQLSYLGEDLSIYVEAYHNALDAANGVNPSAPMNATVLSALQTAISTYSSVSETDKNALLAATNALNTATANATTSIANYEQALAIIDAASTLDAAGQASYAANATVTEIQTAYNERSLVAVSSEQTTACAAALKTAAKAQTTPGSDMTLAIENWDFLNCQNNNFPGWTISAPNGGNTWKNGDTCVEYWIGSATNGEFDYYQTVTGLPAGKYTISGFMWNSTDNAEGSVGGQCGVYGESGTISQFKGVTEDTRADGRALYTTDELTVTNGTLRLGVKNNTTMGARWFGVDYIKLTFVEAISPQDYYDQITALVGQAEGITGKQSATTATELSNAATEGNALVDGESTDIDALNESIDRLTNAVTASQASVTAYGNLNSALTTYSTKVAALDDAGQAAYDVDEIEDAYEAGTYSTQEAQEAASNVAAAYRTAVKAQTTPGADMTGAIVNPTIDGATGWTCNRPKGGNGPLLNGTAFEYWAGNANPRAEGSFDYYQIIEGLPSGKYVVSAEMYNSLNGEEGAEFVPTSGVYASSANGNTVTLVDVDGTNLNRYETEPIFVKDGTLRLGVKNTETPMAARWFVADNFKLTLVTRVYEVSENAAWDNTQEGVGDVTLTRTIKEGFNTIVLPFDMSQGEVEAAFGVGSKVYDLNEIDGDTWHFVTYDGISANRPCILKATAAGTSYNFADRTIVAGTPEHNVVGGGMTGNYAASITVPLGNYIISGDKLYLVDSAVTIKGTRAYFNTSLNAARTISLSFDGVTGIGIVEGGEVKKIFTGEIYDLQGRKVENPSNGIFIVEGKKVVF